MKKKSGIAFYTGTLSASGGTQRMLSFLVNLLIDTYPVFIFTPDKHVPFFALDSRVRVMHTPGGLLKNAQFIRHQTMAHYIRYFVSLDANTVLVQTFLLPRSVKLIIWEHFSLENNYKNWKFTLSRFYAKFRAHKFILLSEQEKSFWRSKYFVSAKKMEVVYNPLTLTPKIHTASSSITTVLAIGNNIAVKGFDLLLKSWQDVKTDCTLKIVGLKKEDRETLQKLKEELDLSRVIVLPKTNHIETYYAEASIFVLSSRKEATPLVLAEAQSFGIPVIAFDHLSGVREIMEDSILYVPYAAKEKGLAHALHTLIDNGSLHEEFKQKSIENSQKFSPEAFKQKWLAIFEK